MKVNGPGRSNLGQERNSWQLAKHARLYSDLLQALKYHSFGENNPNDLIKPPLIIIIIIMMPLLLRRRRRR